MSWDKHNQRWKAYIAIHGRQHHLGYYHSPDAAAAAYARAAAELHGEFARTA